MSCSPPARSIGETEHNRYSFQNPEYSCGGHDGSRWCSFYGISRLYTTHTEKRYLTITLITPWHYGLRGTLACLTITAHSSLMEAFSFYLLTPICTQGNSSDCQATFSIRLIMNSINRDKFLWHKTQNYVRQGCIYVLSHFNNQVLECCTAWMSGALKLAVFSEFFCYKEWIISCVNKTGDVCMM